MKTFFIHQKITAFANQYFVYADDAGKPGELLAFVHQKRFAVKEKLSFYTNPTKEELAFELQAQKILDVHGNYTVTHRAGYELGALRRQFKQSLLRSTWHVKRAGSDEPHLVVRERSLPMAIARRVWRFVPYVGDLPFFLKYHFDFTRPGSTEPAVTYNKITLIRDHYRLDIHDDTLLEEIDWRVLVAQGVALDALQSR